VQKVMSSVDTLGCRNGDAVTRRQQGVKKLLPKLVVGVLGLGLVYCLFRPERIAPPFMANPTALSTLNVMLYPALVLPFVALILLMISARKCWMRYRVRTIKKDYHLSVGFPFKSLVFFLASIGLLLLLCDLIKLTVRKNVITFLDNVSPEATVTINGQLIVNPLQVIGELRKVYPFLGHGSHDTNRFRIEVIDNKRRLILELGRDSRRDREYWVFYPEYRYTSSNDIGRITTSFFDDY